MVYFTAVLPFTGCGDGRDCATVLPGGKGRYASRSGLSLAINQTVQEVPACTTSCLYPCHPPPRGKLNIWQSLNGCQALSHYAAGLRGSPETTGRFFDTASALQSHNFHFSIQVIMENHLITSKTLSSKRMDNYKRSREKALYRLHVCFCYEKIE